MGWIQRELVPSRVTVWVDGEDAEADVFVNSFNDCWKRIPQHDQAQILDYWQNQCGERGPKIELSDQWYDSKTCFGQVRQQGAEIRFAKSLTLLPRDARSFLIAHELAHVYQKCIGRRPGGDNATENEENADRIAEEWGFSRSPLTLVKYRTKDLGFEAACRLVNELNVDWHGHNTK